MNEKITLHFYLRSKNAASVSLLPLYVRLTIDGERLEFSSKKFIEKSKWSDTLSKVKNTCEVTLFDPDIYIIAIYTKSFPIFQAVNHYIPIHNMKQIRRISTLVILSFSAQDATVHVINPATKNVRLVGGHFDVYLKNNCSKEIEVMVRADGSSSTSKYEAGEKTIEPVTSRLRNYADGKLFLKFSDSDSGREINPCKTIYSRYFASII